jgi:hypothetical protein
MATSELDGLGRAELLERIRALTDDLARWQTQCAAIGLAHEQAVEERDEARAEAAALREALLGHVRT